jgi:hypothetical protein
MRRKTSTIAIAAALSLGGASGYAFGTRNVNLMYEPPASSETAGPAAAGGIPVVTGKVNEVFVDMYMGMEGEVKADIAVQKDGQDLFSKQCQGKDSGVAWTGSADEFQDRLTGAMKQFVDTCVQSSRRTWRARIDAGRRPSGNRPTAIRLQLSGNQTTRRTPGAQRLGADYVWFGGHSAGGNSAALDEQGFRRG